MKRRPPAWLIGLGKFLGGWFIFWVVIMITVRLTPGERYDALAAGVSAGLLYGIFTLVRKKFSNPTDHSRSSPATSANS